MVSKKGLSDIVTNVLIILLVLVAIGIVWAFVRPSLDSISGVEGASNLYSVVLSIDSQSVIVNSAQSTVTLKVGRNENSASLAGVEVILSDANGVQRAIRNRTAIGPLESRTIVVSYAGTGLGSPTSVSVAPVIGLNGEERVGGVTDTHQITAQGPPGQTCTPNQSQSCTAITGPNAYPGTRTCNAGGTAWGACTTTLSCGDGTINGNEQCENNFMCVYGTTGQYRGDFSMGGSCSMCRVTAGNSCWCYADMNNDGVLNSADESEMVNAGASGTPPANGADLDCNQDGTGGDGEDVNCLSNLIQAGNCYN
jgi:hypothetical protein